MIDSVSDLADSKPRIRQDVLYVQTADGVLFHNADLGFQVASKSAYRLATALMPYLTGKHTVAELCGGLGDGQREMVRQLVSELLKRGFVRDTSLDIAPEPALTAEVAQHFAAQISYIDHYVDSPAHRFAKLRSTGVAVIGDDPVARWCVLSLVRNGIARVGVLPSIDRPDNAFADVTDEIAVLNRRGCPARLHELPSQVLTWGDLAGFDVVLISDAGATPLVANLLGAGIPDGVVLLAATTVGESVLVGPVMYGDLPTCWVCAVLRFGANQDPGGAADIWSGLAAGVAGRACPLSEPHAAMLGNLLAYEAFRAITGVMPAETKDAVIVQRVDTLDAVTEPLTPHPRCPHHADARPEPATDPMSGITPNEPAMSGLPEVDDADESQKRLLDAAGRLVRPHVGVFSRFDDDQYTQIPLKVARLRLSLGHRERRAIVAFDVHHLVGARWSALFTAAGLYAEHVVPPRGLTRAGSSGPPVIEPRRLATASGTGITADRVASWTPAVSLDSGVSVLVPTAAVQPFGPPNHDGMCIATAAGAGAGQSVGEALGTGLASALAFDALNRAIRGAEVTAVDPSGLSADRELDFLVRSAGNLGVEFELLDLGEDQVSGVYVLLARAYDGDRDIPLWSVGADFGLRRAAVRALRDVIGGVQVAREFPGEQADTGNPLLRAFDPYTIRVASLTTGFDLTAAGTPRAALDRIHARGRVALAVHTTSADLRSGGISTVRVLIADGA
jgi:bacteriocin biosynthesis cyclodehydratase domain-containing protein